MSSSQDWPPCRYGNRVVTSTISAWVCNKYLNSPKYWLKQAWANSVDSDQMPLNAVSDQVLHCFPLNQQFLDTTAGNKMVFVQILGQI